MKIPVNSGVKDMYLVPGGILLEGINDREDNPQEICDNFHKYQKYFPYDYELLYKPLKEQKPFGMLRQIIKFVFWLEKESLLRNGELDYSQHLRFLKEYLGHLWAVV